MYGAVETTNSPTDFAPRPGRETALPILIVLFYGKPPASPIHFVEVQAQHGTMRSCGRPSSFETTIAFDANTHSAMSTLSPPRRRRGASALADEVRSVRPSTLLQAQLGMILDMQVNEGQSLRREFDRLRAEFHAEEDELRTMISECAVADAAEDPGKQLVRKFNATMMRNRAVVSDLQARVLELQGGPALLREHARHFDGIRDEFKKDCQDMDEFAGKTVAVSTRVDRLPAQGDQRLRVEVGMAAFARAIEAHAENLGTNFDGMSLRSQGRF